MFTSATERTAFAYLLLTCFVAFFGGVYEIFSHGVWSGYMVYAFAYPLVLGAVPFAWCALKKKPQPKPWFCRLHHCGTATLTIGSVMQGVLVIYGTTNQLSMVYWIVGPALLLLAQIARLLRK